MTNIENPDFNPETEMICPECGGVGELYWEEICGYVSHEMAMDACDMSYEGVPIYGEVHDMCYKCEGRGYIEKE